MNGKIVSLVCLFAMAFSCPALHIGYLLPVQAFWEMEEQIGAGDLEVVDRRWETGSDFFLSAGWLSLAGNEHAVVLAPERWTYTGWQISWDGDELVAKLNGDGGYSAQEYRFQLCDGFAAWNGRTYCVEGRPLD